MCSRLDGWGNPGTAYPCAIWRAYGARIPKGLEIKYNCYVKFKKNIVVKWLLLNSPIQEKEPSNSWKKRMLIKLPFQIFAGYVISVFLCFEVFSTFRNQFPGVLIGDNNYSKFGYATIGMLTILFSLIIFYVSTPLPNRELKRREAINAVRKNIEAEELKEEQRIKESMRKIATAEKQRLKSEKSKAIKEAKQARLIAKNRSQIVKAARCRIPKDADDFESVCAEWMAKNGYPDAKRTAKGPDGGVDVVSARAVAQSKFHPSQKVGAPDVQALVGCRVQHQKQLAIFFHFGPGYTVQAIVSAKSTGVLLYELNVMTQSFVLVE